MNHGKPFRRRSQSEIRAVRFGDQIVDLLLNRGRLGFCRRGRPARHSVRVMGAKVPRAAAARGFLLCPHEHELIKGQTGSGTVGGSGKARRQRKRPRYTSLPANDPGVGSGGIPATGPGGRR